jgi:adenosine deaminase
VRAFPKVELHVHLESCVSAETIAELAAGLGVPMLRPVDQLFSYGSLEDLLRTCEWWCDLFRSVEIAEDIAYRTAEQMAAEGTVYAEVMTGPMYWTHVGYQSLLPALCAGFDRAFDDGHADCRLIPTISREQSGEWSLELVEWVGGQRLPRIVGLGLDGNEETTGRTCPRFEPAFARAAEIGLGRTAHAGESSGPDGVRDALDTLRVDRIDHGVRAIEDPALVERLADERVTLNVCTGSNIALGLYRDIFEHPIGRLIEAGVPVTVNSDDNRAINVSLPGEFVEVGRSLGWTMADVEAATTRAIDTAFCDDRRVAELRAQVGAFVRSDPAPSAAGER